MADTRNRGHVGDKLNEDAMKVLNELFRQSSKELLLDAQVLSSLRKKISDEKIVDAAYDYYKRRLEQIREKAQKFKSALFRKYSAMGVDTRLMMEKGRKYMKKYDLSESEFTMFMKLLMTDKTQSMYNVYNIPATPMSKTLGYSSVVMGDKLNVSEGEMPDLKIILEKERECKQMHKQLILQTLLYEDCAIQAVSGRFDQNFHNNFKYVHPVIAALFLPKVQYLEERMLLSSISDIIKRKNDNLPIVTKYDYETYWDMITDPNQTACVVDNTKTVADLKNRVLLQCKLWESVMNLRTGKYYADDSAGFLSTVDSCMNNIFDAPDMVYTRDEGTILRRIMNAFSLRPTVINTNYLSGMPMAATSMSNVPVAYNQITTLPVVTLRIPSAPVAGAAAISIVDAINQPQWFIEGKTLVPRTIKVVHSRDVLFFYVNRRFKSINYARPNQPFIFGAFPPSLSGIETLNDLEVAVPDDVTVEGDSFGLRSVVCVESSDVGTFKNCIIGTTAIIVSPADPVKGKAVSYLMYDPRTASDLPTIGHAPVDPIARGQPGYLDFDDLVRKQGTVYMYVKQ